MILGILIGLIIYGAIDFICDCIHPPRKVTKVYISHSVAYYLIESGQFTHKVHPN